MKTKVFLLVLLALLVGCKTPKKMTSVQETKQDLREQNDLRLNEKTEGQKATDTNKQVDYNQTVIKKISQTEYDTTQPVDPNTGLPPVKSTTNTEETTTTGAKVNETKKEAETQQTEINLDNKSSKSEATKEQRKVVEEDKTQTIKYLFYLVVLVVIVALAVWILTKKKSWIQSVVSFISKLLK